MNRVFLTVCYAAALCTIVIYKKMVHEEPWAIGLSQVLALSVIVTLFYFGALYSQTVKKVIRDFFNTADSPVNLAFFRIIFFGWLFFTVTGKQLIWFSHFPKELQFAPMGMGWLLPHLPISPAIASVTLILFKFFCLTAMLGLMTRFSTIMAAATGFYILGVPHFYGSVSHNHHLFWFLVIFAASRPADALSIDAVIKGFKNADYNKDTALPAPSLNYALSLRFIWILISICYFFPGFWKLWNSGTAWIFGDNLRNHMYYDWMGFDHWLPAVRIDQWPWLCRIAGASVILFEMSFPFLLFRPAARYTAIFLGLFFHNMTNLLMNINFYVMQICYVSFLDWDAIFKYCGKRIFPEDMTVLYDGSCSFCRRAIAFLQTFDVFSRIRYQDLHGEESKTLRESMNLAHGDLMVDMHAVIGRNIAKGFDAYKNIAARIPLLWPVYPLLFLGPVQLIGNFIYRNAADHRACRLTPRKEPKPAAEPSSTVLIAVALVLIIGNVIFGFIKKGSGWPFACYPTFSEIAWDRFRTIDCEITFADGTQRVVHVQSLKSFTGSYRIAGLMGKIFSIKNNEERNRKFLALWIVLSSTDANLKRAQTVRFYFLENLTDPAKRHLNPVDKKLAFEFAINR